MIFSVINLLIPEIGLNFILLPMKYRFLDFFIVELGTGLSKFTARSNYKRTIFGLDLQK